MLVTVVVIAMLALWVWWTYPRVGNVLFELINWVEARRSRLKAVTVPIKGMTLATCQGGDVHAPALLLLHGFSADKGVWLGFARHFTADYRVIIPDLAGHGKNPFVPGGDYSIAAQARRMVALLDACHLDKVHVIGSSMGAYVASWLAAHYPERVLSLGLIGAAGVNLPQPNEVEELVNRGDNPFLIRNRAQFDRFFAMTMAAPPFIPEVLLAAEAHTYIKRREELAEMFANFSDSPRMEPWLPQVRAPSLILWGREDRMLPVASAHTWHEGIPHARLEILEGVGHLPMIESPEQTVAYCRELLDRARVYAAIRP
ncbi:alpha/beta hydrolase [Pseudomonas tolaasii]|uniref:Alpha/beta hydrolase n=2 Tax=Pseudomonas tolaasii TaxID=29442 RepID=A0A7Y8AHW3_PSETO|nr:alpha/beta hydrolase [Pseudomonas tolaasii]ARB30617.1 alpha/beta hydrolase [Pseudomonas tolaasii]KAB0468889.1 alpha/beta hydrolase [Pseudomonas tolaasii]MBW1249306.1 alpha/beta hydrolase [Pseudomonas tolaasii]MBW4794379.1 alpha/beta hydrolase [Pseudomonas tolaasii]MBY8941929.1 alpha/beta hydrolase [Pseudomonas tolaasii]